jgi:hypothetical protein
VVYPQSHLRTKTESEKILEREKREEPYHNSKNNPRIPNQYLIYFCTHDRNNPIDANDRRMSKKMVQRLCRVFKIDYEKRSRLWRYSLSIQAKPTEARRRKTETRVWSMSTHG